MLEKPFLRKIATISNLTIWEVDGSYIRRNIDKEFTNCGQSSCFSFIPKDELWIDKENVPGETDYLINHWLITRRLMTKGVSYKIASEVADKIEKRERAKALAIQMAKEGIKNIQNNKKEILKKIHKKKLRTFSSAELTVWIVNGQLVRDIYFIDFTEGGHGYVYSFIPKKEIWIDDDVVSEERKYIILHELHERGLMFKGLPYDDAHSSAIRIEYHARCFPTTVFKKINKELKNIIKN